MPSGFINLALGLAMQVGSPGPSEAPNSQPPARAYGQYGFEGSSEQRHPSDSQMNWVHGYHQEISAYGGHPVFRPYNYKDVLSQSQVSAGWGERPSMPYSQQFWHKYQDQATMLKVTRNQTTPMPFAVTQPPAAYGLPWAAQPAGLSVPNQNLTYPQSTTQPAQTTITIPASLSESLQAPMLQSPIGDTNQINYRR